MMDSLTCLETINLIEASLLELAKSKLFPGTSPVSSKKEKKEKKHNCSAEEAGRCRLDVWIRKISWRRAWQPTAVFLPGKSHKERILKGYSP